MNIQYNRALEKEGGSPERDGGEEGEEGEEGLVWADSSSWIQYPYVNINI